MQAFKDHEVSVSSLGSVSRVVPFCLHSLIEAVIFAVHDVFIYWINTYMIWRLPSLRSMRSLILSSKSLSFSRQVDMSCDNSVVFSLFIYSTCLWLMKGLFSFSICKSMSFMMLASSAWCDMKEVSDESYEALSFWNEVSREISTGVSCPPSGRSREASRLRKVYD